MTIILIADNDKDFLENRAEYLETAGYNVKLASTPIEAERLMLDDFIQLAVLDVRMLNDDDPKDRSGFELAENPVLRSIPKIMLTQAPSYKGTREAMRQDSSGRPYAVNYLSREDGGDAMVKAVDEAVENYVNIAPELDIRFQGNLSKGRFLNMSMLVLPDSFHPQVVERSYELEALFRQGFHAYKQITVAKVLWDLTGRAALLILAYTIDRIDTLVGVFGLKAETEHDTAQYKRYYPTNPAVGMTRLIDHQSGVHLGLTIWGLEGAQGETLETLGHHFRERKWSHVEKTLKQLQKAYRSWFSGSHKQVATQDYLAYLGMDLDLPQDDWFGVICNQLLSDALDQSVLSGLKHRGDRVSFKLPEGKEYHLSMLDFRTKYVVDDFPEEVLGYASPGCLNLETILVSQDEDDCQVWLTDFCDYGPKPFWHDCANLEVMLHTTLGAQRDLYDLPEFYKRLFTPVALESKPDLSYLNQIQSKVGKACLGLRTQVSKFDRAAAPWYFRGLLLQTLKEIKETAAGQRLTKRELNAFLQKMILAAHLIDVLAKADALDGLDPLEPHKLPPLEVVDLSTGELRTGEIERRLSGALLVVFATLYKNQDRVCTNDEIYRAGNPGDLSPVGNQTWVTTNISRLRSELGDKRYILTVRGHGYKLQTSGLEK